VLTQVNKAAGSKPLLLSWRHPEPGVSREKDPASSGCMDDNATDIQAIYEISQERATS
jgi:hypothetical protein